MNTEDANDARPRVLMIWADYAAVCCSMTGPATTTEESPPRSIFTWCPFSLWLTLRFVCRRLCAVFEGVSSEFIHHLRRRLFADIGPGLASAVLCPRDDLAPRAAEADLLVSGDYLMDLIMGFDIGAAVCIVCAYTAIYTRVAVPVDVPGVSYTSADGAYLIEYTTAYEHLRSALALMGPSRLVDFDRYINPYVSTIHKWPWGRRTIVQINLMAGISAQQFVMRLRGRPRAAFDGVRLFVAL